LALIDGLVDGELAESTASDLEQHLRKCTQCRSEHEATVRLKQWLGQIEAPDPGRDYWSETTRLILAKTVDAIGERVGAVDTQVRTASGRRAFVKALVSLAASIVILISAIAIGENQPRSAQSRTVHETAELLDDGPVRQADLDGFLTSADRTRLAKGMLLMSPPGLLGRSMGIAELESAVRHGE
jgi:anti-sigma factor RsiW